jgi:serine/threonine protein kinase/tetratricopeptide (TPR) repeat protein
MTSTIGSRPSALSDAGFADLVEDLTARLHAGEVLDLDAVLRDLPEQAERLTRLLPALRLLEDVSRSRPDGLLAEIGDPGACTGQLGDFRNLREIGRGGMGVVYEAEQISLGRRVALKVLPFAATMDARHLQRFQNEARAAASLEHPHIVPVYGVGCERGVHYYAMKFIDGQSLAEMIPRQRTTSADGVSGPASAVASPLASGVALAHRVLESENRGALTPPRSPETAVAAQTERAPRDDAAFGQIAEWGIQAALALEYAHSLGIIHRDIKPANLLIENSPLITDHSPPSHSSLVARHSSLRLWITDFGLARTAADAGLTITGDVLGTLRYMSPEQALAKHGLVDHRTDIYSLGVTLYELLTGTPAVIGKDREQILNAITLDEPPLPRTIDAAIPRELETIVLKAMEKNPADRYFTAQALADDLRRHLKNEPIRARRSSLMQRARKVTRRHPGVTITAAAAILAGLLLTVAGLAVNNRMVRHEQLLTQDALGRVEREKAIAQSVRYFFREKLLAQADPRIQADALLKSGKPGKLKPDPTVRDLLNLAAFELAPEKIEGQFPGQPPVQAELLKTIGEAYGAIGEYPEAISHLKRARDLQARELAPDHADTLATISSLARAYLDARKLEEAALLFEQVRDARTESLGADDPDTLASMNDLARTYFAQGRHKEALALREDIVARRTARLGSDDPDTIASMSNLANSYAAVDRYDKALELHLKMLEWRQTKLSPEHPHTLQSMNNVANCYLALGQLPKALELHMETLRLRRQNLGEDKPDTLQSMNNVAYTHSRLDQYAKAIEWYEETLRRRLEKFHIEHPDTLKSMNALAWILANCPDQELRDTSRAVNLANETVKRASENGDYWNTLGAARYRAGDYRGAVEALKKSMDFRKGGDASDRFFLAMAHWRLGDKEQARQFYDQAVQWTEEKKKTGDEELGRFRA